MFTIIFPVLNERLRLESGVTRTVEYLQSIAFEDYEIIIVDNGSEDETPQIAEKLCKKYDKVRYERGDKENRPAGAAFEKKQHAGQTSYSKNNTKDGTVKYDPLPKAIRKRKKIIRDFNDKYNLCLTDSQIQNITNSSYMSEIWNREVQSMNQKYNVVYEWFPGRTQWLRVYMYVFHVQEITSDIRQQETIAAYAFEEVFRFFDTLPSMTMAEKIDRINSEFFTSFDDATFMIAYRFLESRGLKHNLGGPDVIKDEDNIDELLKKYSTAGSGL